MATNDAAREAQYSVGTADETAEAKKWTGIAPAFVRYECGEKARKEAKEEGEEAVLDSGSCGRKSVRGLFLRASSANFTLQPRSDFRVEQT